MNSAIKDLKSDLEDILNLCKDVKKEEKGIIDDLSTGQV